MLVCRVIGNLHTVASVYCCVVGGEYDLACMLMELRGGGGGGGGYIVVDAVSVHSCWGGEKRYLVGFGLVI